jgi:hypothetical protein
MGFFYNRERGEVYPAHSGKSLRLYEVKTPLCEGLFSFKKLEIISVESECLEDILNKKFILQALQNVLDRLENKSTASSTTSKRV